MPLCPIQPDARLNSYWTLENAVVALLLALAFCSLVAFARVSDNQLKLVILEVPDGVCAFLKTPGGAHYLLEGTAGGRPEEGDSRLADRIVLPFLYFERALRLEGLLLARPLGEHQGAAGQLIRELKIAEVWAPPGQPGKESSLAALVAGQRKTPVTEIERGAVLRLAPLVDLEVLSPARPRFKGTGDDPANNSAAYRLVYGSFRILFVCDLEAEGLQELADSGQDLRCDILVAPRKGRDEAACASLLSAARPDLLIASSTPTKASEQEDGLGALADRFDCKLVRTEVAGAVKLTTDGAVWQVTTQAESKAQ